MADDAEPATRAPGTDGRRTTADPTGFSDAPFDGDGDLEVTRREYARRLSRRGGSAALDRLCELATRLTSSGSAQVSLISDVQQVAAGSGAAADEVGTTSPAAESLCTVTAQSPDVLCIDDTAADARVSHLPPVLSGQVGSYLGVPLVAGGVIVGALCVFDTRPRHWSDREVASLQTLAEPVVSELELTALEADYQSDRMVWQLAIDAAGVGAFDWDLVTGELRWDERLLALFGHDRRTFGGTIEAFDESVHPDDRDRVTRALTEAIASCGSYEAEYRIVLPDGAVRWISAQGRALAGPDGTAVRVLGAASDVTPVREGDARVARILESMPSAFFHLDPQWRFTYANVEAERLLGAVESDVVGHVVWELFPDAVGTVFEDSYRRAVTTGEPVAFEAYYPPPLDAWYEIRAWPDGVGLSVYFHEVTDRRAAEEARERAVERIELLARVTETLSRTLDAREAVNGLARLIVPELGDWCVVTTADSPGTRARPSATARHGWRRGLRDDGWWHVDPESLPLVERYCELRLGALTDDSFVARALRGRGTVVVPDGATQALTSVLEPGEARDLAARLAPESGVVVPMQARGRTIGLLTVFRGHDRPAFTPDAVGVLEDIARRAALALDNARLYAEQRDLALQLQHSMMTEPPEPDHLQIATRYVPAAEAAQVGGDWYDAFMQPDGATTIVIGDVLGHDTASAAAMGQLRNTLRGVAVVTGDSPAELLRHVDEAMGTLQIETTATVVVARLEQTAQERRDGLTRLRWSNAGHPPPMVVAHPVDAGDDAGPGAADPARVVERAAGVLWGTEPNLLLGFDPAARRDETVVTLPRGTTVLLYTDGLVERRGQDLDVGVNRLTEILGDLVEAHTPLEELCDELLRQMLPAAPEDDVALVAVRLHREDRPRPPEAGPARVPPTVPPPSD